MRILILQGVVFVLTIGLLLLVVVAGNEATKESHVTGSTMTAKDGTAVAVDIVESVAGLYDMPKLSTEVNSKLKELTIMVDMSADAAVAAQVEMSIKIASAWKPKGLVTWSWVAPAESQLHVYLCLFSCLALLRFVPRFALGAQRTEGGVGGGLDGGLRHCRVGRAAKPQQRVMTDP